MDQKIRITPGKPKKTIKKKLILTALFFFILSLLFFFAYESGSITGGTIGTKKTISNEGSFQLKAQLDDLNNQLSLNQEIKEIILEVENSNNILYFGKSAFNLSAQERARITISNFDGRIALNKDKVTNLKGKAGKISVNGLPLSSTSKSFDVSIGGELDYNLITLKEISLKKYEAIKTGEVNIDNNKLNIELHNESILIERFSGELSNGLITSLFGVKKPSLILKGNARNIEVEGKFKTSVLR